MSALVHRHSETSGCRLCTHVAWLAVSVSSFGFVAIANGAAAQSELETVIVTAQKREQNIVDVPMSITAISGDGLAAAGINNALDLSFKVSSMSVLEVGPGKQQITLRGIGSARGVSSLTGTYIDEVPVSGLQTGFIPGGVDIRTIDLQRVEVLKGPQGTLFGEGAAGGVVRFITNDPNLGSFGGSVATKFSNTADGGWSDGLEGIVNLPIVKDVLGVRIAALYDDQSGWIDQPSRGREDINNSEAKHVRAKALYAPTPELAIKAMVEIHRNQGGGSNIVNQTPSGDSNFLNAVDRAGRTGFYDKYDLYNLTATYDFELAELLSSTSYAKTDGVMAFSQLLGEEPVPYLEIYLPELFQKGKITSQELRLRSSSPGPISWTIGAAYKDSELLSGSGGPGTSAILFNGAVSLTGLSCCNLKPTSTATSWAGFGNVSIELSPRWEIGGGLRYFTEDRESFEASLANPVVDSISYDKTTFRFYGKYQFMESGNIYLSIGDGFRSGSFINRDSIARGAPSSYGPEESLFYELGTKMELVNRIYLNAAVFYGEYNGMQEDILIASPVDGGPLQFTDNSQDGEIKGFEMSIDWRVSDRLSLSISGDVIDAKVSAVDPANQNPSFFVGDPVNLVPEYSLSIGGDYSFNWGDSAPGFVEVSFSRKGKSTRTERSNSLLIERQVTTPELNFLQASIGGTWAGWELSLFGRNLLDEDSPLYPAPTGWSAQARPRTFGVGISKSF